MASNECKIQPADNNSTDLPNNSNAEKLEQLKLRQQMEDALTDEERNQLREEAARIKAEGNDEFGQGFWYEAAKCYTEALEKCPLIFTADRVTFLCKRAACYMMLKDLHAMSLDCSEAVELGGLKE